MASQSQCICPLDDDGRTRHRLTCPVLWDEHDEDQSRRREEERIGLDERSLANADEIIRREGNGR